MTKPYSLTNKGYLNHQLLSEKNSLNFLRLIFAFLVVFGHAFLQATGDFTSAYTYFGEFAVAMFFGLSGYLILASAVRSRPLQYLWKRFLRIYPGYWGSMVFVTFIIAPIYFAWTREPWYVENSLRYIAGNFTLFGPGWTWSVGTSPQHVPLPGLWNSPIWTLRYEVLSYLLLAILVYIPGLRRIRNAVIPLACLSFLLLQISMGLFGADLRGLTNLINLGSFFLVGATAYLLGDKIPVSLGSTVLLLPVGVWFFISGNNILEVISHVLLPVCMLQLGALIPASVGFNGDYSYGVYIYAWPIQQMLLVMGTGKFTPVVNFLMTSCLALVVAWSSWHFIEKQALVFKRRRS